MSKDLLIEVGVEEIPAKQLLGASEQFANGVKKALETARIGFQNCEIFATPRRIGFLLSAVDDGQKEQECEVVGPPKRVAYDAEGNPTPAALGFAKTNGVEVSELKVKVLPKIGEGQPNILDLMKDGVVQLVINTPSGRIPQQDEVKIRSQVILYGISYTTTISGAEATIKGIEALEKNELKVKALQEYHKKIKNQK